MRGNMKRGTVLGLGLALIMTINSAKADPFQDAQVNRLLERQRLGIETYPGQNNQLIQNEVRNTQMNNMFPSNNVNNPIQNNVLLGVPPNLQNALSHPRF